MTPNPLSQVLEESLEQSQSCGLQSPARHHSAASRGQYHEEAKPFQLGEQHPADASVLHGLCRHQCPTLCESALGAVRSGGQSTQPCTFDLGSPAPLLSCSLLAPAELGGLPGVWSPVCGHH